MNKKIVIIIPVLIIFTFTSVIIWAYASGYVGRTLKTSTQGCGGCHSQSTSVIGNIIGPDTVNTGDTVLYTLRISRSGTRDGGCDIATRWGTLSPSPTTNHLKIVNGEITQLHTISFVDSVDLIFTYYAPTNPNTDTIWAVAYANAWNHAPSKRVFVKQSTGIENNSEPIENFNLNQNYPNPFNQSSVIKFHCSTNSDVQLKVFDMLGRETVTLVDKKLAPGTYQVNFDGNNMTSGIYFYKLTAGDFSAVKKMTLLK
ncbi:MAG: T9SS type A sorting domain-containing protein [Ignavibacteria bacterium]|nr:T9SS type A sorting domain-containing protein [Ignavibacteria bacterium]